MKIKLSAKLQNMAQNEILNMINPDTLARVRLKDQNPEIRVYVVGHEGEANPNMLGVGQKAFQYFRDAIYKMFNKINIGVQAFVGHGEGTNSHAGRVPVGEIIGKSTKEIGGKLSALTAVHIYPEHRDKKLDVASIEADVVYSLDKDGNAVCDEFESISAVALGDSSTNRPAFPGATLLASMQAFQKERGKIQGGRMDLDELKKEVREAKLSPSDLFTEQDLKGDATVRKIENKAEQTGYEHHKQKIERDLGKPLPDFIKEQNDKVSAAHKERDDAKTAVIGTKSSTVFKSIAQERKLNEKQVAFIEKSLVNLNVSSAKDETDLKAQVNKYVDDQMKTYDETAKFFGYDSGSGQGNGAGSGQGQVDKGAPAGDKNDTGGSASAEDPAKNDFIPSEMLSK